MLSACESTSCLPPPEPIRSIRSLAKSSASPHVPCGLPWEYASSSDILWNHWKWLMGFWLWSIYFFDPCNSCSWKHPPFSGNDYALAVLWAAVALFGRWPQNTPLSTGAMFKKQISNKSFCSQKKLAPALGLSEVFSWPKGPQLDEDIHWEA